MHLDIDTLRRKIVAELEPISARYHELRGQLALIDQLRAQIQQHATLANEERPTYRSSEDSPHAPSLPDLPDVLSTPAEPALAGSANGAAPISGRGAAGANHHRNGRPH